MTKYAMALAAAIVLSFAAPATAGISIFEAAVIPCSDAGGYYVCATPESQVLPLTEIDQMVQEILGPDSRVRIVFWPEPDEKEALLGQAFYFYNIVVLYNTEQTIYRGKDGLYRTFKELLAPALAHELWHIRVTGGHCAQLADPDFLPYMAEIFKRYPRARSWQEAHEKYTRAACAEERSGD